MNKLRFIVKFLKYYISGQTKHDIHSPFVFDLVTNVFENKTPFYAYKPIENLRKKLLSDKRELQVDDFGAGSEFLKTKKRLLKSIAATSAKPKKYAQLLFRLANKFKPETILELGTSLGISSLYLATASLKSEFITLEGSKAVAEVARENFNALQVKHIELIEGEFSETLPLACSKLKRLDLVFFDGNHQKKPTLEYFHQCLPLKHNNTLFIFDDIHWSEQMEEAWDEIKSHPEVTLTLDLFFIGLVFFRKEQPKQHFKIRF